MSDNDEVRLEKQRNFLRGLSQEDRDYIAKYGFEMWNKRNQA